MEVLLEFSLVRIDYKLLSYNKDAQLGRQLAQMDGISQSVGLKFIVLTPIINHCDGETRSIDRSIFPIIVMIVLHVSVCV